MKGQVMERKKFLRTDIQVVRGLMQKQQTADFMEYLEDRLAKREQELRELLRKEKSPC